MIRSPISAEERLQNRVEALEGRVKILMNVLRNTVTLLLDTDARLSRVERIVT